MSYEQMWGRLLCDMEIAVEEGVQRGFSEDGTNFEDGAFFAYKFVLEKMKRMEGKLNESN